MSDKRRAKEKRVVVVLTKDGTKIVGGKAPKELELIEVEPPYRKRRKSA